MKILLQVCCGPCSLEPSRLLREEGHELIFAYINPNIHPEEEYRLRLKTLKSYTDEEGFALEEGSYDFAAWMEQVGCYGEDKANRCRACYRMRFKEAAAMAQKLGCDTLATTLSVSPYQDHLALFEELQQAASDADLFALVRDFGTEYQATTQRAIARGMYRQNYCGCCFSKKEAELERYERKIQRKRDKLQLREAQAAEALAVLEAAQEREAARGREAAQEWDAAREQEFSNLSELEKSYQEAQRLADEARLHLIEAQMSAPLQSLMSVRETYED